MERERGRVGGKGKHLMRLLRVISLRAGSLWRRYRSGFHYCICSGEEYSWSLVLLKIA